MSEQAEKYSAFWILTAILTIVIPAISAVWPLSAGIEMLAFEAQLIVIVPLAFWIKTLIKKNNPTIKNSIWLFIATLSMCIAAYFLRSENWVMHAQFDGLTPWDRFRQYAAFCAFGYACLCILFSMIVLWGRHRR